MQKLERLVKILDAIPGEKIKAPTVIIAGKQSYGKSSLLEGIVDSQFNYTSSDVGTLVPLHFHCHRDPNIVEDKWELTFNGSTYNTIQTISDFLKSKNSTLYKNDQVLFEEIHLTFTSSNTYDLDFIDLPGLQIKENPVKPNIKGLIEQLYKHIFDLYSDAIVLIMEKCDTDLNGLDSLIAVKRFLSDDRCCGVVVGQMDKLSDPNNSSMSKTKLAVQGLISEGYKVFGTAFNDSYSNFREKAIFGQSHLNGLQSYFSFDLGVQPIRDWMIQKIIEEVEKFIPKLIDKFEQKLRDIEKYEQTNIAQLNITLPVIIGKFYRNLMDCAEGKHESYQTVEDEIEAGIRNFDEFSVEKDSLWLFKDNENTRRIRNGLNVDIGVQGDGQIRRLIHLFKISVYLTQLPFETGNPDKIEEFKRMAVSRRINMINRPGGSSQWADIIVEIIKIMTNRLLKPDLDAFRRITIAIMKSWFPMTTKDLTDSELVLKTLEEFYYKRIEDIVNSFVSDFDSFFIETINSPIGSPDEIWNRIAQFEDSSLLIPYLISNKVYGQEISTDADINDPVTMNLLIKACSNHFARVKKISFDMFETLYNMSVRDKFLKIGNEMNSVIFSKVLDSMSTYDPQQKKSLSTLITQIKSL